MDWGGTSKACLGSLNCEEGALGVNWEFQEEIGRGGGRGEGGRGEGPGSRARNSRVSTVLLPRS